MHVLFPNRFGFTPADETTVAELSRRFEFSPSYGEFLATQNGWKAAEHATSAESLAPSSITSKGCPDLKCLFAVGTESSDINWALELQLDHPLLAVFFPIGVDYGGNIYAEVLAGQRKGAVGSLDQAMESAVLEVLDLSQLNESADDLTDPELGLFWQHADGFEEFLSHIHLDDRGVGFVHDRDGHDDPTGATPTPITKVREALVAEDEALMIRTLNALTPADAATIEPLTVIGADPYLSLRVLEFLIQLPDASLTSTNNAVFFVDRIWGDPRLSDERIEAVLAKGEAAAPKNPAIFHNLACVYVKQGKIEAALACVEAAAAHRYEKLTAIREDPDLSVLHSQDRFWVAFNEGAK